MGWFGDLFGGRRAPRPAAPPRPIERDTTPRAGSRASGLPRFQSSAADQLRAFRGGPVDEVRMKLRDAFTPSQPVADQRMFAGRSAVLSTLIRSIEEQKLHVVLYGDRGIGKTSLLHILAQLAGEARYLVHYASCGEETGFDSMVRGIAAEIPLLYHSGYAPNTSETESGRTLADLLPAGAVTPRIASDLFAKLTATRLLVIVDEFDRSTPGQFRRQVAEFIKTLSDRSIPVQLVLAGVASNLTELVEAIPSIRRNVLGLQVPMMAPDEMAELIGNGERVSGLAYAPESVARIAAVAAGSPYLASLIGQHAGLAAIDRVALSVEPADVALAVTRATDEIGARVSERSLFEIDAAEKAGLASALDGLARAALADSGRILAEDAGAAMTRLADEFGLIEPLPGDPAGRYRFREESVPIYLWMRGLGTRG